MKNTLVDELNNLSKLTCAELLNLAKNAKTEEEISFYIHLFNENLAKKARKVIDGTI